MAHSQRGWTGARTPSAIKRVRQTQRRRAINQPRRTSAKTLVAKAMVLANDAAANGGSVEETQLAVERAVSALDRAAKIGAIHANAASRRKSRLMLKVNAVLGGEALATPAKQARTTGKAAAAKQARARIAASRATKSKGEQTAAGKARAALARTSRDTSAESATTAPAAAPKAASTKPVAKASTAKSTGAKASTKAATAKAGAGKTTAKSSPAKGPATKGSAAKASAAKTSGKPAAKKS